MKSILSLLALLAIMTSCQKVIDVDLNESDPKVVIEANYTAEDSTVRVTITMTSSYFDSDPSPTIDNAQVSITDGLGVNQSLTSLGNGKFELVNYIPVYNSTYKMNVVHDGINYEAQCKLFPTVALNDLTFEYFPGFFGSEGGYATYLNFQDPPGIVNYYIAVLTRNGVEKSQVPFLILQDDKFSDGNIVERPLFSDSLYQLGDLVGLELRSVDESIYYYYDELSSIAGSQSAAAPANPESNWNNGALGYFSAYSNSRKEAVIQ